MIAIVLPPIALLTAAILVPLVGWPVAGSLTLFTCSVVVLLVEIVALTIDFVPFARAYPPGHANLKSLWWLYLLGVFVFAYWPARLELRAMRVNTPLLEPTGAIALAIVALDIVGRWRAAPEPMPEQADDVDDADGAIVLDIGPVS